MYCLRIILFPNLSIYQVFNYYMYCCLYHFIYGLYIMIISKCFTCSKTLWNCLVTMFYFEYELFEFSKIINKFSELFFAENDEIDFIFFHFWILHRYFRPLNKSTKYCAIIRDTYFLQTNINCPLFVSTVLYQFRLNFFAKKICFAWKFHGFASIFYCSR